MEDETSADSIRRIPARVGADVVGGYVLLRAVETGGAQGGDREGQGSAAQADATDEDSDDEDSSEGGGYESGPEGPIGSGHAHIDFDAFGYEVGDDGDMGMIMDMDFGEEFHPGLSP